MYVQSLLKKMTDKNAFASRTSSVRKAASADQVDVTLKTTGLIAVFQDRLEGIIPWNLKGRLQVSLGRDRKLVLLASDSVAVAQARMMLPAIQRLFKDLKEQLKQNPKWRTLGIWQDDIIKMKVTPRNPEPERKKKPALPISEETGLALRELAETCGNDELSQILKKLATHAK